MVENELLDWTLGDVPLGDDLLELGAGTGTVTAHLCGHVRRLTAVDIERASLIRLQAGSASDAGWSRSGDSSGSRVRPVCADAVALPFATGMFSGVVAFTMLHHVAGRERQRLLLSEARRVLRPGGTFVGCDPVWTLGVRLFHVGDTFEPVAPNRLADDLGAAGFDAVDVFSAGRYLRWRARRCG
ncbi:MAG: class I SAM-dependent methyltransferase [bacterium]